MEIIFIYYLAINEIYPSMENVRVTVILRMWLCVPNQQRHNVNGIILIFTCRSLLIAVIFCFMKFNYDLWVLRTSKRRNVVVNRVDERRSQNIKNKKKCKMNHIYSRIYFISIKLKWWHLEFVGCDAHPYSFSLSFALCSHRSSFRPSIVSFRMNCGKCVPSQCTQFCSYILVVHFYFILFNPFLLLVSFRPDCSFYYYCNDVV